LAHFLRFLRCHLCRRMLLGEMYCWHRWTSLFLVFLKFLNPFLHMAGREFLKHNHYWVHEKLELVQVQARQSSFNTLTLWLWNDFVLPESIKSWHICHSFSCFSRAGSITSLFQGPTISLGVSFYVCWSFYFPSVCLEKERQVLSQQGKTILIFSKALFCKIWVDTTYVYMSSMLAASSEIRIHLLRKGTAVSTFN